MVKSVKVILFDDEIPTVLAALRKFRKLTEGERKGLVRGNVRLRAAEIALLAKRIEEEVGIEGQGESR